MTVKQLTPADLRADIARYDLQQKDIAERAHLHPNHLSGVLKGSRNLTTRTAADIARVIGELIAEKAQRRRDTYSGQGFGDPNDPEASGA